MLEGRSCIRTCLLASGMTLKMIEISETRDTVRIEKIFNMYFIRVRISTRTYNLHSAGS